MRAKGKGWRLDYFLVSQPVAAASITCQHRASTLCRTALQHSSDATICTSDCASFHVMQVSEGVADRVHDCYHLQDVTGRCWPLPCTLCPACLTARCLASHKEESQYVLLINAHVKRPPQCSLLNACSDHVPIGLILRLGEGGAAAAHGLSA